ncbi:MAG: 1-acyl-sn-glycerol-3-phosphate acyltransferase [Lentimicrobiaceae bacterium]|nr:1-acyl-sn-glycerol-3-phosphate acyltransferase [Lentimicrobiaceae bacterium]
MYLKEDTINLPQKEFINLESVIKSKSERLAKMLPRFILSYLKRIIHETELNGYLEEHQSKFGLEFIEAILNEFGVIIQYEGLENISTEGRYILAANHPLGGLDGMALMYVTGKVRKDIVFPVNDLLLNLPNLKDVFIPINKHGRNAANLAVFDETFASNKTLLYFPAGLCSRKIKGKVVDLEWKKTFISKARKYQRDIIPVHISGSNSGFFYNLANLRKFLGIKVNIEMLYLVDEMIKQKNKVIRIRFGTSIPYTIFDKKYNDSEWANLVKKHVYAIENGDYSSFISRVNN